MKKVLDNFEDISVESSIVVLTDFFKRVGAGIIIGLLMAIFFGWASYKISFVNSDSSEVVALSNNERLEGSPLASFPPIAKVSELSSPPCLALPKTTIRNVTSTP